MGFPRISKLLFTSAGSSIACVSYITSTVIGSINVGTVGIGITWTASRTFIIVCKNNEKDGLQTDIFYISRIQAILSNTSLYEYNNSNAYLHIKSNPKLIVDVPLHVCPSESSV